MAKSLSSTDPNVDERDESRLRGQNAAMLERLLRGPATNVELAGISLKYTSRISDLRKHGYVVVSRRGDGGLWIYNLVKKKNEYMAALDEEKFEELANAVKATERERKDKGD